MARFLARRVIRSPRPDVETSSAQHLDFFGDSRPRGQPSAAGPRHAVRRGDSRLHSARDDDRPTDAPASPRRRRTDDLLDMDPATFRAAAHEVVDLMADYLESIERYAVFPNVEPGSIAPLFPASAPDEAEPIAAILADYRRLVEPERDRTGSTRASWRTSRRRRPARGSSARCSPPRSARTRCCGGPRRSRPSSRASSSAGSARRSACPRRSTAC